MPLSPVAAALALCALVLPVSIAGSNIALALLALALLFRARRDGALILRVWRSEPALAALVLYGGAGLLAAALSAAPSASLRDAVKDFHRLWSLGLFAAALALEPETPLRPALGLSFGAIALYGIVQAVFRVRPESALIRAHGFVHPVVYGEMMALAVLGGACVLLRPTAKAPRRVAAAFTALAFAALLLSQTRMALIGAFVGFALVALLEPRARRWALPVLLLVAAAAAAWEFLPVGGRSLSSVFGSYDPHNPQQARWVLWDVALRVFRDHPATGAGPGGYHRLFSAYHSGTLDGEGDWGSAHNLYLHQLAERGLAGGLALLVLCGVLLARAVKAAREQNADTRALWSAGVVAAFLAMSLTETSFQNEQFAALLLLIWAWGTTSLRAPDETA
jgi:O-antigen ligase